MSGGENHRLDELWDELERLIGKLRKAYRELEDQALKDDLTGLYNRRAFNERLREEVSRARRYGEHLSLLFLDIDGFKDHNDSLGHLVGDQLLQEFSKLLDENKRGMDVYYRYGGEEFVGVLPETGSHGAYSVAERLRESVANHAFAGGTVRLTVSVGVATFPDHVEDEEALIAAADGAQYAAKQAGKDRIEVASSGQSSVEPEQERVVSSLDAPSDRSFETGSPSTAVVGFGPDSKEPRCFWVGADIYPITCIHERVERIDEERMVVSTSVGQYVLTRRGKRWFVTVEKGALS